MSTHIYSTTITATFRIEVEAESLDEAERIVDGVLDSTPAILVVEGAPPMLLKEADALLHAEDMLRDAPNPDMPSVLVRGSMHRRRAKRCVGGGR